MLILLVFGSAFMWPLTNSVLNTGLLKWLGGLSVVFFLILPLVGFVIWAVRRFNGSKSPNKTLRTSFGGLWGLGFASAIAFGFLLYSELRTEATITETVSIPVQGDTLHVSKLQEEFGNGIKVTGLKTLFKNFYRKDNEKQYSKIISFDRKESEDDRFYVEIEKSASGSGNKGAVKNAKLASVENEFVNNEFKIAKYVSLPKDEPFRFQHAKVTFYVPKDKVLDVDPKIKRFKKRKRNIHINADWDDLDKETKEEIEESVEEAMDEVGEALEEIGDAMEEVGVSIEKAGDEIGNVDVKIEKAEKETEAKLRIEKQKLRIKKEQLKLEELQRSIDKSKTLEE
jgi:Mg2+ and Co2+ transporter CorA